MAYIGDGLPEVRGVDAVAGAVWRRLVCSFRRGQFQRELKEQTDGHLRMKQGGYFCSTLWDGKICLVISSPALRLCPAPSERRVRRGAP
jgi:hypothetical protein